MDQKTVVRPNGSTPATTESPDGYPPDRDGGVLSGLLAPLRLPERVVDAIESIAAKLEDVRPMRQDVETIREQSADLNELLPALDDMKTDLAGRLETLQDVVERLEGVESHLDERVGKLCKEISGMHGTLASLQDDVQRITDRVPDSGRGPLERARDVLTGGD